MREINHSEIKSEWKKGLVVAAETEDKRGRKIRAVVQEVLTGRQVRTIYGDITPKVIYSFKTLTEARTFLDELSKVF